MPVPTAVIDENGLTVPSFSEVLSYLQSAYRSIYGADVVLDNDTQDGQWVSEIADAINRCNAMVEQAYNSRGPATAQGAGLASIVKINGIAKRIPTYSQADVLCVGQAGVVIESGKVRDDNGFLWSLPSSVTIPLSGQIEVTATCDQAGAIRAAAGEITGIATPTAGWQTVVNLASATAGAPVETDAELRIRQSQSTMIPSIGPSDALRGALGAVDGVTSVDLFENDTDVVDEFGIAPRSLACVVGGGSAVTIGSVISRKKGQGVRTIGTQQVSVQDTAGAYKSIYFSRPKDVSVTWSIDLVPLPGYTVDIENSIKQALVDWSNALGRGEAVVLSRAYAAATLSGSAAAKTFRVRSISVGRDGLVPGPDDIAIAYYENAYSQLSYCVVRKFPS